MNIYLIPVKRGKYLFYSKQFQTEPHQQEESDESKKQHRFRSLIKAVCKTVAAKRERNEKLLKEMKQLTQITIYYPANLTEENAREIYDNLIQSQIKKHKRWLIVDGTLLPLSAIFSLVPGPNILMAYLAWRTLMHYKTKKGGERAASDLGISFVKEPQLQKLSELVNKSFVFNRRAKIRTIGDEIGIIDLEGLI